MLLAKTIPERLKNYKEIKASLGERQNKYTLSERDHPAQGGLSFHPEAFPAPKFPPPCPCRGSQSSKLVKSLSSEPNPLPPGNPPQVLPPSSPPPRRRAGALAPGRERGGAGSGTRGAEERGSRPASPAMRLPLPALLCCSAAGLLLLLLPWRRRRGLWRKVKEARQRQERSLVQMEMAVRRFREQVGAVSRASPLHPRGRGAADGQSRLRPPRVGSSPRPLPLAHGRGQRSCSPSRGRGGVSRQGAAALAEPARLPRRRSGS